MGILAQQPKQLINELIPSMGYFPNNSHYPFLVYKEVFHFTEEAPDLIQRFLEKNLWINSWVDTIYPMHHYHSNTHEALVVTKGSCQVQIGGDKGTIHRVESGDVIIFPAGVAHKNLSSSPDFQCIGAYPEDIEYDICYGRAEEHPQVDEQIKKVGLPASNPAFGPRGLLFNFWK